MKNGYIIDIDNTICVSESGMDYSKAKPIQAVIDKINELYHSGHHIILFTARGMYTYSGKLNQIERNVKPVLVQWLREHQVNYHQLQMGKPWMANVIYVDDKAIRPDEFVAGFKPEDKVYDPGINMAITRLLHQGDPAALYIAKIDCEISRDLFEHVNEHVNKKIKEYSPGSSFVMLPSFLETIEVKYEQ